MPLQRSFSSRKLQQPFYTHKNGLSVNMISKLIQKSTHIHTALLNPLIHLSLGNLILTHVQNMLFRGVRFTTSSSCKRFSDPSIHPAISKSQPPTPVHHSFYPLTYSPFLPSATSPYHLLFAHPSPHSYPHPSISPLIPPFPSLPAGPSSVSASLPLPSHSPFPTPPHPHTPYPPPSHPLPQIPSLFPSPQTSALTASPSFPRLLTPLCRLTWPVLRLPETPEGTVKTCPLAAD